MNQDWSKVWTVSCLVVMPFLFASAGTEVNSEMRE